MLHSQRRIIALCTDFGLKDSYVAQMKGVILSLAPEVRLIDLSHEISPHDVLSAARFLETSVAFYPADTIFLAVVDPGVGGKRRRIIVEAELGGNPGQGVKRVFFVGPDNGIFSLAAPKEKRILVREIQDFSRIPALPRARTFDGRNVFSPVAALIALGIEPAAFGPEIESRASSPQILEIQAHVCELLEGGCANGEVVSVDQFGNCITNIKTELVNFSLSLPELGLAGVEAVRYYAEIPPGEIRALVGSSGFIEIAAKQRSAREILGIALGAEVLVQARD